VNVTNTGRVTSDVTVLAFVSSGQPNEPLQEVFDFGRLSSLLPAETRELHFTLSLHVLASGRVPPSFMHRPGALYLWPGNFTIRVGDTRANFGANFVETLLSVTGDAMLCC